MVDGNDLKSSVTLKRANIKAQYEEYSDVLNMLAPKKLNIVVIHPAVKEDFFPSNINLDDFSGVVWTGSTLNIYDMTPPIIRQIELALSGKGSEKKILDIELSVVKKLREHIKK